MRLLRKLLCRLRIHGPDWHGIGASANSHRNQRVGGMLRHCGDCGAYFVGEEIHAPHSRSRVIAWTEKPASWIRQHAEESEKPKYESQNE